MWVTGVEAGLDNKAGSGGEEEDGHAHRRRRHAGHRVMWSVFHVYFSKFCRTETWRHDDDGEVELQQP